MPAAPSVTIVKLPPPPPLPSAFDRGSDSGPIRASIPGGATIPGELDSWKTRFFFAVQIFAAIAILVVEVPKLEGNIFALGVLIALVIVFELMPIAVYGTTYVTAGFAMTLAIIILFGAPGSVISSPFEALAGRLGRRKLDYKIITNGARFVVVHYLGVQVYMLLGEVNPSSPTIGMVAGGLITTMFCYGLSLTLATVSASLRTGQSMVSVFNQHQWIAPQYLALGVVGLAVASAYIALGLLGVAAFFTPVLMMRFTMKQYVDKTKEYVAKLQEQNTALKAANVQIVHVSDELAQSYDGTLEALVNALDARDQETKGHSVRVQHYMMDIARELGIKEGTQQWLDMYRGSLLHDVGKIGVIDSILLKPGKLTDDEWTFMRKHPEIGFNMLHQVRFLEGAAEIILAHHERWDGKGYPRGLHEQEIPLGARIFPVVDTFDAMTSNRPYRKALSTMDAMNEILKFGGTQFDPLVVEAFLDIYPTWVKQWGALHAETDLGKAA